MSVFCIVLVQIPLQANWYTKLLKQKGIYQGRAVFVNSINGLNLRNMPSRNGRIIHTLRHNTPLLYLQKRNGWVNVDYLGQRGWVHGAYVKPWDKIIYGKVFESGVSTGRGRAFMLFFNKNYAFLCTDGMQSTIFKVGRYTAGNDSIRIVFSEYIRLGIFYKDFANLPVEKQRKKIVGRKKIREVVIYKPAIVYDGFSKKHALALLGSLRSQYPFIDRPCFHSVLKNAIKPLPVGLKRKFGL